MKKAVLRFVSSFVLAGISSAFAQSQLGLWTFEGTAGRQVSTVANEASPGTLDMAATRSATKELPVYSSSVPGASARDPLTNKAYKLVTSLEVGQWGQGASTGVAAELDSDDGFTLQLWINLPGNANKSNVIIKRFSKTGWRILSDESGRLYAQFNDGEVTTDLWSEGGVGSLFDGKWHNLVLTFNGVTGLATFSVDGVKNSISYTGSKAAISSNGLELIVGTNAGHGNFSVLSYARGVLSAEEMISLAPEDRSSTR